MQMIIAATATVAACLLLRRGWLQAWIAFSDLCSQPPRVLNDTPLIMADDSRSLPPARENSLRRQEYLLPEPTTGKKSSTPFSVISRSPSVTLRSNKTRTWFQDIRIGSGIIRDFRSRLPYYASDWTDAWNYRVVPAIVLIFFAKTRTRCAKLFAVITRQFHTSAGDSSLDGAFVSIILALLMTRAALFRRLCANPSTLPVGPAFQPAGGREWLVRFWELDNKWIGIAFPFGVALWVLFFFDHNVSAQSSRFASLQDFITISSSSE
ncbi:hypothetical protein A0H81_08573 [Grifola frondosa]|uniref:Uncharacterized protein n=1 Tax=Grifola frondosa TaxID=5627 RepID=A0A1C7M2S9_GRIFR|nr:hypothetical protein A0H81_08573 [Grifola frondosa]